MGYESPFWSYGKSILTNSDGTQLDPPDWSYGQSKMIHLSSGTIHDLAGVISSVSSLSGHLSLIQSLAGIVNAISTVTGNLIVLLTSSFGRSAIVDADEPGSPVVSQGLAGLTPDIGSIDGSLTPSIEGK